MVKALARLQVCTGLSEEMAHIMSLDQYDTSFFVYFESLRHSQQFFSHVKTGLPGLN